jgi:spermidine synthase
VPPRLSLRYLDAEALGAMFRFPADMAPVQVEINRLDNQQLVRYYDADWRRWQ